MKVLGCEGAGVNIDEALQHCLFNSAGELLNVGAVWHLELSSRKHAFLTRGESLTLFIKEFGSTNNLGYLNGTGNHVALDLAQTTDLLFGLNTALNTVKRQYMRGVSAFFSTYFVFHVV